ncbi:heavy-metal-associated domain-containing protein [bacterium]|nr:heavy-metal-associated domain-containing protein [bacterium]
MKNKAIFTKFLVILFLTSNLSSMGEKLTAESSNPESRSSNKQSVSSSELPTIKKETFFVEGISCGSCSNSIETNLKNLKGFISADINIETGKVSCTYDSSKLNISTIKSEIDKAGFTVNTPI